MVWPQRALVRLLRVGGVDDRDATHERLSTGVVRRKADVVRGVVVLRRKLERKRQLEECVQCRDDRATVWDGERAVLAPGLSLAGFMCVYCRKKEYMQVGRNLLERPRQEVRVSGPWWSQNEVHGASDPGKLAKPSWR